MGNGIERQYKWNSNVSVGVAYIAVPFGVDRDLFVDQCYRKERVNIILDQGGTMVKNCHIDSKILQEIKFPDSYKSLGSQIVFVMDSFNKVPIVIANISRTAERVVSGEEKFTIHKAINGGDLSIVGSGEGKLFIKLESTEASNLTINVKGKNSTLKINCDGTTTIYSKDDINIGSSSKIIHNEGGEPIPLGNTLKVELEKFKARFDSFLDTFSNTVVIPSDGGAAIQTAVKIALALKKEEDFDNINSKKSFVD